MRLARWCQLGQKIMIKPSRKWSSPNTFVFQKRSALSATFQTRLHEMKRSHDEISNSLISGSSPPSDYGKVSKQLSESTKVLEVYNALDAKLSESSDLQKLANSGGKSSDEIEIAEMAREELSICLEDIEAMEESIKMMLLPKDEDDDKSVVVEIRATVGGDEAALFANELFLMYQKLAQLRGWKFEIYTFQSTESGGCKGCSFSMQSSVEGVFSLMKFESGVHRVQRVPATESAGRVHTSAAAVVVLPEVEDVDVDIKPGDLRIETMRSQGAGGQHVNTTDSAVRITHIPTGIQASIQEDRSQHRNKALAMSLIRARVYELEKKRLVKERDDKRGSQIVTGDRSERIRTYNYPQGRVTDHRAGISKHSIEKMLEGVYLMELIDDMVLWDREQRLMAALEAEE